MHICLLQVLITEDRQVSVFQDLWSRLSYPYPMMTLKEKLQVGPAYEMTAA